MITWFLIFIFLTWFVVFRYRRRHMYKLAIDIPAPKCSLPAIGMAHTLIGSTEDIMTSLKKMSYETMDHNGIIKVWLGHILYFVLTNPVDTEMVLKTCLEKDDLHRFLRKVIGNGGIFAPVSIWKQRRKIMVPTFRPNILDHFVPIFSQQSEVMAKKLTNHVDKGSFQIWPFINTYMLDSICETAMGVKINSQENPESPVLEAINRLLNIICERIFHLWLQPDWIFKLSPQYREYQKFVKVVYDFTDKVIANKREDLKIESETYTIADHEYDLESYKTKSFLDLLISISRGDKGYTNTELREEMLTLSAAGTDTSAVAVGYTLQLLGKYPKIQDKVYQELYEVFGDTDRLLEKEDLTNLKYLDRVVKESLRLFPPVPFIVRKVLEDVHLPSGRVLPAGAGIFISIWGIQRDPKYWGSDSEHFDPDRFLPERFQLDHGCSYMPFSSGPRNCLGYRYALMSIKTLLSTILRRYKVVMEPEAGPIPHIRAKFDIMMKAVDGYQLSLTKRMNKAL